MTSPSEANGHTTELQSAHDAALEQLAQVQATLAEVLGNRPATGRRRRSAFTVSGPPRVFAYLRVSHLDSAESGWGIETTREAVERYIAYQSGPGRSLANAQRPKLGWEAGPLLDAVTGEAVRDDDRRVQRYSRPRNDGLFIDLATSAYRKRLEERPAGAVLCRCVRPGDHIVFARLDRSFRNLSDYCETFARWERLGVNIHFVDVQVDGSTAIGQLILNIMAAIAQWQSQYTSERVRETNSRRKRELGLTSHNQPAMGWKRAAFGKMVPDLQEREDMVLICRLRDHGPKGKTGRPLSWEKISDRMEELAAAREARAMRPPAVTNMGRGPSRYWTRHRCEQAYIEAPQMGLWPERAEAAG